MSLFGGSTTTTTNEKADTGPSAFQRPYLDTAFGGASSLYQTQQNSPYYQGQTYAGMTDADKATLDRLRGFAGSTGLGNANALSAFGNQALGYQGQAGQTLDQFTKMAGSDPTQANIASATAYANNPAIDGMVDAAGRDVSRTLNEQTLPGIDRQASGTGGINSSRAGVAAGIAQRGAADRIGDLSAQIRGDAYDKGLSLAENARSTNLGALGSAASQYGSFAGQGASALGAANGMGYDAYNQMTNANQAEQADNQGQLDANLAAWQGQDQRGWDILNRYNGVVGSSQWGQSGTTSGTNKVKQNTGIATGILGGLAGAAGMFTGMGGSLTGILGGAKK